MSTTLTTLPYILLCVVLNTGAQLLLKIGTKTLGEISFSWVGLFPLGLRLAQNPAIMLGLILYVLSVAVWLFVLSRVDVSYAYPLSSLGYVLTALVGSWYLGEILTPTRWLGIMIILGGVYLVSRS